MVLERLGESLHNTLKKILGLPLVDEAAVKDLIKDLQRALLQADVNVKLVFDLSKRIEEKALKSEVPPGLSRREQVVKAVYDELALFLGERPASLPIEEGKTNVIMLVGIQGSGKTTTSVKIARFLKKRGVKTVLVCADTYRPGALAQLRQLASQVGVPVYGEDAGDPLSIAERGVERFRREGYTAIIVDTAGRHKDEASLMDEMRLMAQKISPSRIILVIDGTVGQRAAAQAEAFNATTRIGAICVSKLDGSARGGGALSAVAATGAPIVFIGTGEKVEDIELFDPPRFVGRLLGMGDIRWLLEKAREAEVQIPEKKVKAMLSGKMSLMDVYEQLENLRRLGPIGKILRMIPGLGYNIPDELIQTTEERMSRWKAILQSMTPEERENPKILNSSRIRRIARGSGTSEKDVKGLLQQYEFLKRAMKTFMRKRASLRGMEGKLLEMLRQK